MAPCLPQKYMVRAPSYLYGYPRKTAEKAEPKRCSNVVLQDLIDLITQFPGEKEEQKPEKKKLPCGDVKPPSKKKFEQLGLKNICGMPYSRKWISEEKPCRGAKELPKWFGRQQEKNLEKSLTCPRELDDYEKSLWVPICKPSEPFEESCPEPVDENVCVFCLECLYSGGFIHDLFEKVPLIKKQSEIYGDEIAQRIGIRTRITVHKKCYDAYIDVLAHKEEKEVKLENEVDEESDDLNCGEEEEEEEQEEQEEQEKVEKGEGKKKREQTGASLFSNLNFCVKKFQVPEVDPGKRFQNRSVDSLKDGIAQFNSVFGVVKS